MAGSQFLSPGYILPLVLGYVLLGAPGLDGLLSRFTGTSGMTSFSSAKRNHTLAIDPSHFIKPDWTSSCSDSNYKTYLFSREPLIVYLEDLLSTNEADTIMRETEASLKAAYVGTGGNSIQVNSDVRNSTTSPLSPSHELSNCIARRVLAFQGWPEDIHLEQLWAQKYVAPYGHYSHHFDWAAPGLGKSEVGGRQSSFMVYLQGEESGVKGGGTNFPKIDIPLSAKGHDWCRFIECDEGFRKHHPGVTFKALKGNAVFWENFRSNDKSLVEESFHAGMPVEEGEKWGLNIWSWWTPGWTREDTTTQARRDTKG